MGSISFSDPAYPSFNDACVADTDWKTRCSLEFSVTDFPAWARNHIQKANLVMFGSCCNYPGVLETVSVGAYPADFVISSTDHDATVTDIGSVGFMSDAREEKRLDVTDLLKTLVQAGQNPGFQVRTDGPSVGIGAFDEWSTPPAYNRPYLEIEIAP